MLRIKLPAVGPSNFINTSGATTHEKKIIDPKIVATEIKPMRMSTSDISIPYKKFLNNPPFSYYLNSLIATNMKSQGLVNTKPLDK